MNLHTVREFSWPLLDSREIPQKAKQYSTQDVTIRDNDIDTAYGLALRHYDGEQDRIKAIETKSSVFTSALGITIAILLGVAKDLVFNRSVGYDVFTILFILMMAAAFIYLIRTVWFSVKALERCSLHTLGSDDYVSPGTDYKKGIVAKLATFTNSNSITINSKLDSMNMTHAYFKRAVVCIAIGFALLVLILFSTATGSNGVAPAVPSAPRPVAFGWVLLGFAIVIVLQCYTIMMLRRRSK